MKYRVIGDATTKIKVSELCLAAADLELDPGTTRRLTSLRRPSARAEKQAR